jgi:hypothetical protein
MSDQTITCKRNKNKLTIREKKEEMKQSLLQNSFMTLLLYVNNPKGVGINIKRSQLSKKVDIELQEISDKCIPV